MHDWRKYVRQNLKPGRALPEDEVNAIEEIASQLEDAYREALNRGLSPEQAAEEAKLHITDWDELSREVTDKGRPDILAPSVHMETRRKMSIIDSLGWLIRDVRYATRRLRRSAGFTFIAILTLGLGIGGNTVIFSAINSLLWHPGGLKDADRIFSLGVNYEKLNVKSSSVSIAEFVDVRDSKEVFASAAIGTRANYNYSAGNFPERLSAQRVTWQWFDVFGAKPLLGRLFTAEEDQPNVNRVVILDYRTWQTLFGEDRSVIDRTIELNQQTYKVVGVMGPEFRQNGINLWTPLGLPTAAYTTRNRFNDLYTVFARIKPGVSLEQALAHVRLLTDRVHQDSGAAGEMSRNNGWSITAQPYPDAIAGDLKSPMFVLMGAVGFVLLIACANVAGLMIARGAGQTRELAVRRALGAGRWHLIRQMLTESLLIAGGGVLVGVAIAYGGIPLLVAIAPPNVMSAGIRPDATVMGFTAVLGVAAGIFFGMIPAFQIGAGRRAEAIKEGGRSGTSTRRQLRFRSVLVALEIALALVLLVGSGLFLRSLFNLQQVDTGFDARGVMTGMVAVPPAYRNPEKLAAFHRALLDHLGSERGITKAATGFPIPFVGEDGGAFLIEGAEEVPGQPAAHGGMQAVSAGYFETLGISLVRGRTFTPQDTMNTEPVTVIDENLARQYWPNEDPIGKRIRRTAANAQWTRIVGIVRHVKQSELASDSGRGVHYYPVYQTTQTLIFAVMAKTSLGPDDAANAIRAAVRDADPGQAVFEFRTMEGRVLDSIGSRRFAVELLGIFAAMGSFMAAIGLYGVISYVVAQRTHEIGIRMALGARATQIVSLVLWQGMGLALAGIVLGSLGAFLLARLLSSQLFQVPSFDPEAFGLMAIAALIVALLASIIPARRAASIDPLDACRYE
jgi:putative ABC transport system permease protein